MAPSPKVLAYMFTCIVYTKLQKMPKFRKKWQLVVHLCTCVLGSVWYTWLSLHPWDKCTNTPITICFEVEKSYFSIDFATLHWFGTRHLMLGSFKMLDAPYLMLCFGCSSLKLIQWKSHQSVATFIIELSLFCQSGIDLNIEDRCRLEHYEHRTLSIFIDHRSSIIDHRSFIIEH